jgi:starch phosphorylase
MKFAMSGAITIGTLDGANVEIREAVGAENFALFGLTADEVSALKGRGYDPRIFVDANPHLQEVLRDLTSGAFSRGDRSLYQPLVDSLLGRDEFMLAADYQMYVDCQDRVGRTFLDRELWTRMSILNASRVGGFSSDRAIQEYCDRIWRVTPVPVRLA